jgi:nucleoside-diphosphate-sugar epimerase
MLTDQSIFLTGGTGFLGRHLVSFLLERGCHLYLLVRPTSDISWLKSAKFARWHEQVELVVGDITDREIIERAVAGSHSVVHAAGHFRLWGAPQEFARVNVRGTEIVAEAVLHSHVNRLIYISTVAVVGVPPPGEVITEETHCNPLDAYQRSKFEAEKILNGLINAASLPAIIFRPGAFYGPGGHYGFNRLFIEDPLRGLRIQVDQGRHLIFPVFVKDVAQAVTLALEKDWPSGNWDGRVYNICDQPYSHAHVNQLVSELLGINSWRLNVPRWLMIMIASMMERWAQIDGREPFYPLNLRYYVFNDWLVSNEKARRDLGFEPTSLWEGLSQTVAWYRGKG